MGRRVIAVFAAAVIALVGVASVLLYARGADARAVAANQPSTAYVSKALIPSATTLKDAIRGGLLVKTTVPEKGLPAGALTQVTTRTAACSPSPTSRPVSTCSSPGSAPLPSAPRPSRSRPAWSPCPSS